MRVRSTPEGYLLDGVPSGGDPTLDVSMLLIFLEAFELWAKKQKDYGPENIAQAGEPGVALRLNDKVQRLRTLFGGATPERGRSPINESIRDSWIDACVYGAIGVALRDGHWPAPQRKDSICAACGRELNDSAS